MKAKAKRKPPRKFFIHKRVLRGWRLWRWVFLHAFWSQPLWRDRLRCPICKKVGTFKPHHDPLRWLCKWCGYFEDPDRIGIAFPCLKKKVWMLKPIERGHLPKHLVGDLDPWRG